MIDGYVDVDTLNILEKKNAGVDVKIYTFASAQLTNRDAAYWECSAQKKCKEENVDETKDD